MYFANPKNVHFFYNLYINYFIYKCIFIGFYSNYNLEKNKIINMTISFVNVELYFSVYKNIFPANIGYGLKKNTRIMEFSI